MPHHARAAPRPTVPRGVIAAAVLALLAGAGAPAGAQSNALQNGGFEDRSFAGWTLGGDLGDTRGVCDNGLAYEGQCYARLQSAGPQSVARLSQSFATSPGTPLTLRFWLWNVGTASPNFFGAYFDGRELVALRDLQETPSPWTEFRFDVTATQAVSTLEFRFADTFDERFRLDAVRADVVPEPSTYALLAAGLVGVGGAVARRRRALA